MNNERIYKIKKVVASYFEKHPDVKVIRAKELMPEFVKAGIYKKDHREGLPIRNDLRALDREESLKRIPNILAIRKKQNTNWYFVALDADREQILNEL